MRFIKLSIIILSLLQDACEKKIDCQCKLDQQIDLEFIDFNEFESNLDPITVNGIEGYILEEDIFVAAEDLRDYYCSSRCTVVHNMQRAQEPKLVSEIIENQPNIWRYSDTIKYSIEKHSFIRNGVYMYFQNFQEYTSEASMQWNETNCIFFEYHSEFDNELFLMAKKEIDFYLKYEPKLGTKDALSFFPNARKGSRVVCVSEKLFNRDNTIAKVGIMTHEFGHILGFIHERDHPASECSGIIRVRYDSIVGSYDKNSIMHHSCTDSSGNTIGNTTWVLSDEDILNIHKYYPIKQ